MSHIDIACSPAPQRQAAAPGLSSGQIGLLYALGAYGWWGLVALYFRAVSSVPALEVTAHRVVWAAPVALLLVSWGRRWGELRQVIRSRRTLGVLALTTGLIALNWYTFIFAVASGNTLQASLGYYINPLLSILLAMAFLGERLRPMQMVAVACAATGVAYLTYSVGQVPLIGLTLAASFGLYGLLRKTVRADALLGLSVETLMLTPLALAYVVMGVSSGSAALGRVSPGLTLLLMSAGLVTFIPLLWFAAAARRLPLSTVGFMQYIAPTGQFLLAVLAFGEPFTAAHAVCFPCIWVGLLIFSIDAWRSRLPRAAAALADQRTAAKESNCTRGER